MLPIGTDIIIFSMYFDKSIIERYSKQMSSLNTFSVAKKHIYISDDTHEIIIYHTVGTNAGERLYIH